MKSGGAHLRSSCKMEPVQMDPAYQDPEGYSWDYPRKYWREGLLKVAWQRTTIRTSEKEYKATCHKINAKPNSMVSSMLHEEPRCFENMTEIDLSGNYLGERGFLAILPVINSNTMFTSLNVSQNGLRNEAVAHLVDMLLREQHSGRQLRINLSRNPISDNAVTALTELANRHPGVIEINLWRTNANRRKVAMLNEILEAKRCLLRSEEPGSPTQPPAEQEAPPVASTG